VAEAYDIVKYESVAILELARRTYLLFAVVTHSARTAFARMFVW
jgi:hypothetical protein